MFNLEYDEDKNQYFVQIADYVNPGNVETMLRDRHSNRFGYYCDKEHLRHFYEELQKVFDDLPRKSDERSELHICPVCQGRKQVPEYFYCLNVTAPTTLMKENCRSCIGKGYIKI